MILLQKPHISYGRRLLVALRMLAIFVPALLMPLFYDVPYLVVIVLVTLAAISLVRNVLTMTFYIVEIQQIDDAAEIKYYEFNTHKEAKISNWARQAKVVQRFSKYSSYLLRIRTDDGRVVRQYEVCEWSISDFSKVGGGTNLVRSRQFKMFVLAIIAAMSIVLAMDRCTKSQKAVVCDQTWEAYKRPLLGVVRITWPLSPKGSYFVCSVVDQYSGDTIEIYASEFRAVARDGDSVIKTANDVSIAIRRGDSVFRAIGVQPSSSCRTTWAKQYPERIDSFDASMKKSKNHSR